MNARTALLPLALLAGAPTLASARALHPAPGGEPTALDDAYTTTTGNNLSVDAPGVLDNDSDPESDPLTAVLLSSAGASGNLILQPDGSLEYEVAPGFVGTDTFTYAANDGTQNSAPATITFTVDPGPIGGGVGFADEASFLAAIAGIGALPRTESFESALWPRSPAKAPAVSSLGVTWTGNNPTSQVTTGPGPAIFGQYGFFQLPHGDYATGFDCNTPGNCTDGWIATADEGSFVAAGLTIHCNAGTAGIEIILDGDTANPVDFGGFGLPAGSTGFFGVVSTDGFQTFEVHETEGKAEDASFIFADGFTFAFAEAPITIPYGCGVNPEGSLVVLAGAPRLGGSITLGLDNPAGTQAAGSRAYLSLSLAPAPGYPCGPTLPGAGMSAAGAPGEFLLSVTPPNPVYMRLGPAWSGPGSPAPMTLGIPGDPVLAGISVFAQGALIDFQPGAAIPIGLTEARELVLAP